MPNSGGKKFMNGWKHIYYGKTFLKLNHEYLA
jgi:hypothetical protein